MIPISAALDGALFMKAVFAKSATEPAKRANQAVSSEKIGPNEDSSRPGPHLARWQLADRGETIHRFPNKSRWNWFREKKEDTIIHLDNEAN